MNNELYDNMTEKQLQEVEQYISKVRRDREKAVINIFATKNVEQLEQHLSSVDGVLNVKILMAVSYVFGTLTANEHDFNFVLTLKKSKQWDDIISGGMLDDYYHILAKDDISLLEKFCEQHRNAVERWIARDDFYALTHYIEPETYGNLDKLNLVPYTDEKFINRIVYENCEILAMYVLEHHKEAFSEEQLKELYLSHIIPSQFQTTYYSIDNLKLIASYIPSIKNYSLQELIYTRIQRFGAGTHYIDHISNMLTRSSEEYLDYIYSQHKLGNSDINLTFKALNKHVEKLSDAEKYEKIYIVLQCLYKHTGDNLLKAYHGLSEKSLEHFSNIKKPLELFFLNLNLELNLEKNNISEKTMRYKM